MSALLPLFLGASLSFIGSLPPGIISMTVVENTLQKGLRAALALALGAALIEGLQALLALQCAGILSDERTKSMIQIIAIILFSVLGFYSFYLAQKGNKDTLSSQIQLPQFWKGVTISLFNVLAIPYWLVNGAYLDSLHLMDASHTWIICFCIGVATGTFLLLLLYARLSQRILNNIQEVNKWTNVFLGVVFLALAIAQFWQFIP